MKLKSYAQYGEDDLIWKFFNKKLSGLIVEVGAFDGKYFSNSYALEKLGWTAICIEANPYIFPLLMKNRPNAININAAIIGNDHITSTSFFYEPLGLFSGIELNQKRLKKLYDYKKLDLSINTTEVKATTLNKVFEEIHLSQTIDCISIDIEGTELEALKGLNLLKYAPKLIIIETNNENAKVQITSYLAEKGYVFVRALGVNSFFIEKKSTTFKHLQNIKIDCITLLQYHYLGWRWSEQSKLLSGYRKIWYKLIRKYYHLLDKTQKAFNSKVK